MSTHRAPPPTPSGRTSFWRTALALALVQSAAVAAMWGFWASQGGGEAAMSPRTLLFAAAVIVVLSVVMGLILSRRLSARIRSLEDAATRFASGDLRHRIPRQGNDELAELGETLNDMAGQLASRIDALQKQQQEQRLIFQSMSSGVLALDATQRILNINRAAERMLRIAGSDVRGRLLHEVVRQGELHRLVASVIEEPSEESIELELAGNEPRIIKVRAERLAAGNGAAAGVVIVLDDITQIRRLEAMRSEFASNVSHELRTPITNIKGYAETLLDVGFEDRSQTERFVRVIRDSSNRLAAIIDDIMSLTSLEMPRAGQKLETRPTRLLAVIKSVLDQFSQAAAAKNIRLACAAPDDLSVRMHAQLIEQAIGNLVDNAVKYSSPSTTVSVRAAREASGAVRIMVADQGPGIPAEHLTRIFERFYRVDKARSRELGGTGLGLAIVKHIAVAHGGQVTVDSTVGKGSTFSIHIPAS